MLNKINNRFDKLLKYIKISLKKALQIAESNL